MAEQLITNKPLKAKAVYILNAPEPLKDRVIWFFGDFVIVGLNDMDSAPTWYNQSIVMKLEGVEPLRELPQTRIVKQMGF